MSARKSLSLITKCSGYTESRSSPGGFVDALYRELHQWLIVPVCCRITCNTCTRRTRIHMLIARAVTCIPVSCPPQSLSLYTCRHGASVERQQIDSGKHAILITTIDYNYPDRFATSIHPALGNATVLQMGVCTIF